MLRLDEDADARAVYYRHFELPDRSEWRARADDELRLVFLFVALRALDPTFFAARRTRLAPFLATRLALRAPPRTAFLALRRAFRAPFLATRLALPVWRRCCSVLRRFLNSVFNSPSWPLPVSSCSLLDWSPHSAVLDGSGEESRHRWHRPLPSLRCWPPRRTGWLPSESWPT